MSTVFIYALKCPVTNEIRYVGKARNPAKRYAGHLRTKDETHRGCWIRSVIATGGKPIMEILDEVPDAEWPMWEVAYIQFFREEGGDLVNSTCGGEGVEMTLEIRGKLKIASLGKKLSAGTRAKMSAALSGENCSAETRAKKSAAHVGKKLSPEHCAKLSAAKFGKKLSPEHCAKMSAARSGENCSAETRAKISAANLGKKNSPEARAKMSAARLGKKRGPYRKKHSAAEKGRASVIVA